MFKRNMLNFVLAGLLLFVGAAYLLKNDFNHSGPQTSIWDNIAQVENPPSPNPPIVEPPPPGQITTYEEAIAAAKRSPVIGPDRKILIVFGAEWCGWCTKLDKETIRNREVNKAIAEGNIINIHVDVDKRKDLAKKFSVRGIPAYVIIDKDENIVRQGSGFKDPSNFISWMLGKWGTKQNLFSWLFGK
jgi:thiol-disulfide isomerase/thioredoxin